MTEKVGEGGPKRNASSAKQSRGQNVWSVIQSNVLGSSVDKDMHCEHTRQNGSREIFRGKLLLPH